MSKSKSGQPQKRFQRKGFKILGLGLQDIIKYFFGGNASIAVVVLILICAFLLKEGFGFFPSYHHELKEYRKSGQEFVAYVNQEVDAHTRIYSDSNIAYYAELNRTSKTEDNILSAYRSVGSFVKASTSTRTERLERYFDRVEEISEKLEDLNKPADPAAAEATEPTAEEKAAKKELEESLADYEGRIESLKVEVSDMRKALLADASIWEHVRPGVVLNKAEKTLIREAVMHDQPGVKEKHPDIERLENEISAKKKIAAEELIGFKETVSALSKAARPLKSFQRDLKDIASENAREGKKFSTAEARYKALLEGAEKKSDPAEKAAMIAQAEAVDRVAPDYEKLTAPLIAKVEEHATLSRELAAGVTRLVATLPGDLKTESAQLNLERVRNNAEDFPKLAEKSREGMEKWEYDKSVSVLRPVWAFFFGKDWVSNSSWRDFYGLLPLFTGSLLISIIALVVAVPFALSAAVYVNQLASIREQNFVKPAIEFIEAIPSVVLGFFGILVLGTALRHLSQLEFLSWVPGFPMSERLTILNAGLLLALMAVPTIFTLAEDALNNVPGALTENSLAMGASKLQTVLHVVFPASASGIIAAVLLGFGRIIGETMVVLLVAGNKIKIPDFTEGLGVVTQPSHTMTGIIAQELGEVDQGSLHWGALFMVGLVLFFVSLTINFSAQQILKKLQKI